MVRLSGEAIRVILIVVEQSRLARPAAAAPASSERSCHHAPRRLQLDRAHGRVPLALTVPVTLARAFSRLLVTFGMQVLADFQLHQRLAEHPHAVAQHVGVLFQLGLAQQLDQCHPYVVGHRIFLLVDDFLDHR